MIAVDIELDVIVVNYKTYDDLQSFIDSYYNLTDSTVTNLVVVDVEGDPRQVVAASNVVRFDENIGYARACNFGANVTSAPYLAFFNADTVLKNGVLDLCVQALRDHSDWGVVGPLQVDEQGRVTHAGIFGTHAEPRHRAWKSKVNPALRDVREAITVSGSAYFTKRETWNELKSCDIYCRIAPDAEGAFLPTPHFYEETWYSYHAHSHGWKVMYLGTAEMIHKWHKASPVGGKAEKEYMPISREMFRRACDEHGIDRD